MNKRYIAALYALYGNSEPPAPRSPRPPRVDTPDTPTEAQEQMALVSWARDTVGLPLISIPNHGRRSLWAGQRERAMGLTAGVADLFLPVMRGGYGGFWIELKRRGKKPTVLQYQWLDKMRAEGYRAAWYDNWVDARVAIEEYLGEEGYASVAQGGT